MKRIQNTFFIVQAVLQFQLCANAQSSMNNFIVNDAVVDTATIQQLEKTYSVKFVPGNYWYDKLTGAFGLKNGPCTGIGVPGLNIGGVLKADASGGATHYFINGRALHPTDVAGLQTFMQPMPGRYWMDAYGNFGYEGVNALLGNIYLIYQAKFSSSKKSSYYKNNVWSGEKTSFGSDGNFMYYSSKKTDGTSYEYSN
jgi:hypothetical protein